MDKNGWLKINTVPEEVKLKETPIFGWEDGRKFIMWWTNDVYSEQGGRGGPSGWFSGRYFDHWCDNPILEHPTHWQFMPDDPIDDE